MKLSEAVIGQRVVVIEPIEDEFRWRHFERIEGVAKFSAKYVCVKSLRTVQGRLGMKPRWDSGEKEILSEMPASTPVVDASTISHDWTEAHDGLMVVNSGGWLGFYLNQKLFHVLSSHERPQHLGEQAVIEKVIATIGDIPIGHAVATWQGDSLFKDELSKMRLIME